MGASPAHARGAAAATPAPATRKVHRTISQRRIVRMIAQRYGEGEGFLPAPADTGSAESDAEEAPFWDHLGP
ncbi:hypothetical protein MPRM_21230 [Mycobacterium parmense]|uniref:Uncharacterized protein n=1 Tax=Mycobacterium parmense TaxID=185642 RepID=A0A7I7YUE1_9MYCO|nr:hypothetical protein MPRM_21230 [Mycobacterium parmense]